MGYYLKIKFAVLAASWNDGRWTLIEAWPAFSSFSVAPPSRELQLPDPIFGAESATLINAGKNRRVNERPATANNAFHRRPSDFRRNVSKIPFPDAPTHNFTFRFLSRPPLVVKRTKGDTSNVSNTNYLERPFPTVLLSNRNYNVLLNYSTERIN